MEDVAEVSLVLMGNTKFCKNENLECVFDLKGSMVNRIVKGKNLKNTATLKDKNLLKICTEKMILRFKQEDIHHIMEQLELDVRLLKK